MLCLGSSLGQVPVWVYTLFKPAVNHTLCFWIFLSSDSCTPLLWYYTGLRQSLLSPLLRCSGLVAPFQLPPAGDTGSAPHFQHTVYRSWRPREENCSTIQILFIIHQFTSLLKAHLAFLSNQGPLTPTIAHSFKSPLLTDYNLMFIYPSQNRVYTAT